jgi:ATP-binding cassette, subfamily G (WHITE), member 2, SNQ2
MFLIAMTMTMKSWFRAIAAAFKSEATANSFAGMAILVLVIYTGYTIPKPSMIGALRWITYVNVSGDHYRFCIPLTHTFIASSSLCDMASSLS